MLADDAVKAYNCILESGASPALVAGFLPQLMQANAAAFSQQVETTLDMPMQDGSILVAKMRPGLPMEFTTYANAEEFKPE